MNSSDIYKDMQAKYAEACVRLRKLQNAYDEHNLKGTRWEIDAQKDVLVKMERDIRAFESKF